MKSIRRTLSVWLLSAILTAGVIGAVVIYRNALAEADGFFDYHLRQTALVLRDQAFEAASNQVEAEANAYDFVVQVWSANGVLAYQSQPHASLPDLTALEFSTVKTGAGEWRAYGVETRGYVIQVAQPMQVRRDQAARLATRTLLPFLIVVPVLALIVLVVVPHTLRPVHRLADELAARSATSLQAISVDNLSEELRPLVTSFNDLLSRLAATLDREQAFIADAAHELRTPLTALRLQLSALLATQNRAERTAAEQQLSAGVARAGRLVEQLLSLARISPRRQATAIQVQLDDLLREVVAEKIVLADARRIDLGVTSATPYCLQGDASALRALVGNLIDNAIHYAPDGGRVDVSLAVEQRAGVLRVIDNGPGIPESERARVFERFYRAADNRLSGSDIGGGEVGGSGLGLAIVKSVAEQHGAKVRLDDAPNTHGLTVTVSFNAESTHVGRATFS